MIVSALCAFAFGVTVAAAAEMPADQPTFEETFDKLQNTPVYKSACTETCHGNIAQTKNYSSAIIFQHGYHQLVACNSCHPRFPHRADQTIERPTMQGCFDCHGVRHGPMGLIADDKCEACHVTPKERLRPAFHTWDWANKPHVQPSIEEFNTRCAMCHTKASCDDCHQQQGIDWKPASWEFNSGDGCMACHGNAGLTKQTSGGQQSFSVVGVNESVHGDLSCQDCHPDYRYDDEPQRSAVWTVNAGLACANCHAKQEDERLSSVVSVYNKSVHAEGIRKGNANSATCASCHGGHFIYSLKTDFGKARMQASAYRVCARCHDDSYASYNDQYHGKAYKEGAADAPACWDCHGDHEVLPVANKESLMGASKKAETCGTEGCHTGSSEDFAESTGDIIHQEPKVNPIVKFVSSIFGG